MNTQTTIGTWSVYEFRGRAGLLRLESDWRRLYAAMPNRSCVHPFDIQLAYVDHVMENPSELRCLAVDDGRVVRAICLLEPRIDRTPKFPLRVWCVPLLPHTRIRDVICADDEVRREIVPVLLQYLRRKPEGRAVLQLGSLYSDSPLWEGLASIDRALFCVERVEGVHVLDCSRPFVELFSALPRKLRQSLRRRRRRLDELGEVRFATVHEGAELAAGFERFLDLEAAGWKGRGGTAIRQQPGWPDFFRAFTTLDGVEGRCDVHSLHVGEHCIASELCVLTGDEYTHLKIGYDEAYSKVGPGTLLIEYVWERCCGDPSITRANLLNEKSWEKVWRPDALPMQDAYIGYGHWAGRPLIALLKLRFGLGRRVVWGLRRWRARTLSRFSSSAAASHPD